MAHTTLNEVQVTQVLIQTLQEFREKVDPEMPLQQLLTLLVAARDPGVTMQDVMKELDVSSASVSRNVAKLGRVDRHHEPGFDLVTAYEDPMERRRKVVDLTSHGKQLIRRVAEVFNKQLQIAEKRAGA